MVCIGSLFPSPILLLLLPVSCRFVHWIKAKNCFSFISRPPKPQANQNKTKQKGSLSRFTSTTRESEKRIRQLTCDDDFGSARFDLSKRGPSDALASVTVQSEILFNVIAADVQFDLQLSYASHRIDEIVRRVVASPWHRFAIAVKMQLKGVGGAARQCRCPILHHVRVFRLFEQERKGRIGAGTARSQRVH